MNNKRKTGIEALKLFAIIVIVISHVVQTLGTKSNGYISFHNYYLDLTTATGNLQQLCLSILRYNGEIGNTLFFICSAWFFLESDSVDKKKILTIIVDVWVISVLCLFSILVVRKGGVGGSLILMSIFPSLFENNWYIGCYLIFYAIHPLLNQVIHNLNKKLHFRVICVSGVIYFGISFISCITKEVFNGGSSFFSSRLVIWTVLYLIIAYMKLYVSGMWNSRKFNIFLTIFGLVGHVGIILLTYIIELKTGKIQGALLVWNVSYNPFIISIVIGSFNLMRMTDFYNRLINYVASLSLFIYIIHENLLIRTYYRPAMWQTIYLKYGYEHILVWTCIMVLIVLTFGILGAIIYKESIHKAVMTGCNRVYPCIANRWRFIEDKVFKIHHTI